MIIEFVNFLNEITTNKNKKLILIMKKFHIDYTIMSLFIDMLL